MDLDELEVSTQVPSRTSRFAPKTSKLKPKPKSEPEPQQLPSLPVVSKTEPHEFNFPAKKNEDHMEIDSETKLEAEDDSKDCDHMDANTVEEDQVVREIDVLFTPSIDENTQLNLLQFPLRPNWRPYELDEECEEIRWKPESSEAELDLSIDSESSNIDKEFAKKLNHTKQTLSTSWKPHHANGCAVGLLMGDKIHLHPIHAVVQLRPSLRHLDSGGSKKMNITGANATTKNEVLVEEKSAATTSKKQNKPMKPSIEQKSDGDECWVPLKYHGLKSDMSSRYFQQMVAQESSSINFTMSAYDYIATLCPGVTNNISKGPSKRYLLSLPVEERLKKMLTEGPLHRFSTLKHIAPEYTDEELLEYLWVHAVLLWGFWVPKSSLLYPDGGPKSLARDYVLVLFSKNVNVQLSDVNVRGPLDQLVKNFLKILGVEKVAKSKTYAPEKTYWKFREIPDESFIKGHPNVVKKQEELFKITGQRVCDAISNAGKLKHGKSAAVNSSVKGKVVKSEDSDSKVTNMGGVPHGKMTMSSETRQALPIVLKKLFQAHKVCSFQMILQGLREMAVSNVMLPKGYSKIAVDAAEGPPDELKAVISEVAWDIHGYYVLKSSPDEPFRDVVIDMLRGSGPNAKLKKSEILEAARRKLSRDVPNNEYIKVMGELCVTRGSVWVLKSGDGSMK